MSTFKSDLKPLKVLENYLFLYTFLLISKRDLIFIINSIRIKLFIVIFEKSNRALLIIETELYSRVRILM